MKAIKDYKWEIHIHLCEMRTEPTLREFWEWTTMFNLCGLKDVSSKKYFSSEKVAEENWEKFAKLNGIKKWRYV